MKPPRSQHDYRFLYAQDDPATLSADRPLITSEIHTSNDFYGQASVLKRYAGLRQRYPLKVVMEHGVNPSHIIWEQDCQVKLPVFLSQTPEKAVVHQRSSGKPAIPVGFGFLYAKQLVERDLAAHKIRPGPRIGTVVFPCHSTHSIKAQFEHADYARQLDILPAEFHPISICMYWKDYLDGAHAPYQERGFRILSSGHMFDSDFMLHFYDVCRQFKYAASNHIGSHLFLAANSGCRFFYISSPVRWDFPEDEEKNNGNNCPHFHQVLLESQKLFASPTEEITSEQQAFVDRVVGTDHMKSPAVLRRILFEAELRYLLCPSKWYGETGCKGLLPYYWHRKWNRLTRFPRRVEKGIRRAAKATRELTKRVLKPK